MIPALRRFLFPALIVLCSVALCAQESLTGPVPLSNKEPVPASQQLLTDTAAERALSLGFNTLAAQLYEQLLTQPDLPGPYRNDLLLGLATAYMNENRLSEAEHTLGLFIGERTPLQRLRAGMVMARQKRYDQLRRQVAELRIEDLPPEEQGWHLYLQGVVAYHFGDNRAGALFQQAIDAAANSLQRTRFVLAEIEARLADRTVSETDLSQLRQTIDRFPGKAQAHAAISQLAIALNTRGDRSGATTLLQNSLQSLPREQRLVNDEWSLLLGMIAGAADGAGRNALRNLLTAGTDRDKQRVALQLLARASTDAGRRDDFRAKLDELIAVSPPHPLLEELLLFRSLVALNDPREGQVHLSRAEDDATQLLQRFPGSQLKGLAYTILTNAAWQRAQYRNAASLAAKARERDLLPSGELRANLGVLLGEAYFRAGDFAAASDAYAAALNELPAGIQPGDMMFMQILSEIRAGRLEQASRLLDTWSRDLRFDSENRYQAEWNLARGLQAGGQISLAYARLNQLLNDTTAAAAIPPDLLARMKWLQARLSFEVGEYRHTLELAESLLGSIAPLPEALRADIASTTMLLQVQANFALSPGAPSNLLQRLRAEYPNTDAAVYSYVVEADAAAREGRLVDAQRLLTSLGEQFPRSPYAPYAWYQAARYAEQRAQPAYYREANDLLERLVQRHADSELVLYARLQQGHLMRKLQDFGRAQQAYAAIENETQFAQHPARYAAQLALADTHAAQAANSPSHVEAAHRAYERLLDLPTAPIDLRLEAGHKYGLSLSRHGQPDAALRVWGLVMGFLINKDAKPESFGPLGRYWMARTVFEFGDLLRRQGRVEQAREAYELIIRTNLPGATVAQDAINRLQPAAPRP